MNRHNKIQNQFFLNHNIKISFSRGEYRDDPNERRSMVRSVSTGGGYSGTGYDQSVRARAAASGPGSTDTPLNKLQYKYWVTKSKVVRKLGKEEDECITLSDAQLDAKLELYKSIHSSTQDLSRILDQYNDRLCSKLNYYRLLFKIIFYHSELLMYYFFFLQIWHMRKIVWVVFLKILEN